MKPMLSLYGILEYCDFVVEAVICGDFIERTCYSFHLTVLVNKHPH